MAMTEIVKQLKKRILQQRAAGALDPKKHLYSFEGYLSLLQMLKTVLYAGMPPDDALDAVQTGWGAEKILEIWRYTQSDQPVPVAHYTLAVDRRTKRDGELPFI